MVKTKQLNIADNINLAQGELYIGDNVHIAPFCIIQAHGGVFIGNNSGLSSGVKIYSFSNVPTNPYDPSDQVLFTTMCHRSAYLVGSVVLDDNVGIALNSIILPGVHIEKDSFVAPMSLVINSFEKNSYITGYPAKRIKNRFIVENLSSV